MEDLIVDDLYTHLFNNISKAGFVSPKARAIILDKALRVEFKQKEIVLEIGEVCRNCYFIVKGLMRAYFEKDGKDVTAWLMTDGDVAIGVTSFYTQTPSKEFIVAVEHTICISLSYNDLQTIYTECIDFNIIGRRLTEKYHMLFTVRLSRVLDSPKEKYLQFLEEYPDAHQRGVTFEHIASYLGISRETLARIRRELKKCVI